MIFNNKPIRRGIDPRPKRGPSPYRTIELTPQVVTSIRSSHAGVVPPVIQSAIQRPDPGLKPNPNAGRHIEGYEGGKPTYMPIRTVGTGGKNVRSG